MFIFSNLAISLDGKIATSSREYFPLGTDADRKMMQVLRKRADAILMGASSLRTYRKPFRVNEWRDRGGSRQPLNVIVTRSLDGVNPAWPFFKATDLRRVIFYSGTLSPKRAKEFSKTSDLIKIKDAKLAAPEIVKQLRLIYGIQDLLVEGGGQTMWDFAKFDLIDEYYVTLTPWILGGTEAPTLVDGEGFNPKKALSLKLKTVRKLKNELYLVYSRK